MTNQIVNLQKGEMLFSKGDKPEGIYILKRGRVEVFIENKEAKLSLALLEPESVIGEISLFDDKPRSASIIAVDSASLNYISNEKLTKSLARCPKWFVQFVKIACGRLRAMNRRLAELQDNYYFNIKQIHNWIEMLHVIELLFYKKSPDGGQKIALSTEDVITKLKTMFLIEESQISDYIDILVGTKVLQKTLYNNGSSNIILESNDKLVPILQYLHKCKGDDLKRYCDLEQFEQLLYEYMKGAQDKSPKDYLNLEEIDALAQASVDDREGDCRRRHFRIFYKIGDNPVFESKKGKFHILDLSEEGLRLIVGPHKVFKKGEKVKGKILFPHDRGEHNISGKVVRIDENYVAFQFNEGDFIPLKKIMSEQRILVHRK
ncbi:MAG: hypothetical protein CMP10_02405 [Zetaproteobacteria bacterium]|nr:hypothetical protein [Pseudobdellovibrionaceae bacterium]